MFSSIFQHVYADKKVFKKKAKKIMYKGLNCDRKSQLSEILTESLNPRGPGKIVISPGPTYFKKGLIIERTD